MGLAPHNPLGPVNLAASIHLGLTVPGFLAQEQLHLGDGIPTRIATRLHDGAWTLPTWQNEQDRALARW